MMYMRALYTFDISVIRSLAHKYHTKVDKYHLEVTLSVARSVAYKGMHMLHTSMKVVVAV